MPTYQLADSEIEEVVATCRERYHGALHDHDVRVQVLLAWATVDKNGDPRGNAITVNGYGAWASIRVLPLRERVIHGYDARMELDAEHWQESSDEERLAIVDHELTHLNLVLGKRGLVKRDDADRPKLRLRRHDRHFGWFDEVARRHGDASIEVTQAKELVTVEFRQLYLFEHDLVATH